MKIVVKLPDFVMQLLEAYLLPIRQWLSEQIYADLVGRDPTHLLVCLKGRLNLTELEQACSGFHHLDGRGAPPKHEVHYLVRALIVRYVCNWPLRELEWQKAEEFALDPLGLVQRIWPTSMDGFSLVQKMDRQVGNYGMSGRTRNQHASTLLNHFLRIKLHSLPLAPSTHWIRMLATHLRTF